MAQPRMLARGFCSESSAFRGNALNSLRRNQRTETEFVKATTFLLEKKTCQPATKASDEWRVCRVIT